VHGVLAIALVLATADPALAERRLALVIGNGAYSAKPLANARNDAELITRTLASVGFEVTKVVDADQDRMRRAIAEFGRRLKSQDSVGVFYFAGHGIQVAGRNFLIPVGNDIASEAEIALYAVDLALLLTAMKSAQSRIAIAILDACRDNPFEALTRSGARGLAPVSAPSGSLIAFATAPGEVAYDGAEGNSPYASALSRTVPVPGLAVEEVFKRTRELVLRSTAGAQTPWEHSSLVGHFVFKPKQAEPEPSERPLQGADLETERQLKELADWNRIKTSSDPTLFRRHLQTYPGGYFEEAAHFRIAELERWQAGWAPWITGAPAPPKNQSEAEAHYERALRNDGPGASTDQLAEAARHYRLAADLGLVAAMHNLARMYDQGRGVAQDLKQAAHWYGRAAEADHAGAMVALGSMHEFGEGVAKHLAEALRLYRLAAERGDAQGMASLGFLYAIGKGVARDALAARDWYAKAAAKGNARAMFNLALLLLRAEGGGADWPEAVRLLRLAATDRHAGALRELAVLHDEGRAVARDPRIAADYLIAYYRVAHRRGRADAFARAEAWSLATRRAVQKSLAELGLYGGPIHGIFDARTRAALARLTEPP
jgi:TPR repeat protein